MSKLLLVQIVGLLVAVVGLAMWLGVGLALFVGGAAVVVSCERNAPSVKPPAAGGDG
jgi:hypothetical protein